MEKHNSDNADTVVVLDFETTGLSPGMGDRAIEIGAVKIVNGHVTDTFQDLMNPGCRISGFIESYTGISNNMLKAASPCEIVMERFCDFLGGSNLVAHNASFDKRFLDAEFERIHKYVSGEFACSMLVARRVYPEAPNHKLGTLVQYKNLPNDGTFHRALADSQMTAHLWLAMVGEIEAVHDIPQLSFKAMQKLSRTSRAATYAFLSSESGRMNSY